MFAIFCNGAFVQAAWGRVGSELFICGRGKHAALPIPKELASKVLKRVRSYGQAAWLVDFAALNLQDSLGKEPTKEQRQDVKNLVRSIIDVAHNPKGTRSTEEMSAGVLGLVAAVMQWLFEQEFFGISGQLIIGDTEQERQAHRQAVELFTRFLQTRGQLIQTMQNAAALECVEVAA